MDLTYQLMEQVTAAAGTTGQTGAKRNAGTQNESDGGFDTMVRQKRQENTTDRTEAADKAAAGDAAKPAPEEVRDDDRIEMAAAMLLQPQPEIVYVQDTTAEEEALPAPELAVDLSVPETPEALPEQPEAPAEQPEMQAAAPFAQPLAAARDAEKPAEPAQAQKLETPEQPDAQLPRVELDGGSEGAALSPDARRDDGEEQIGNRLENVEIETPVFGSLDAAPVKVGASETLSRPVELAASDAAEQLGAQLESLLTDETGSTRVELSLAPANLGKLTVEITHGADGSLHVLLSASTEKAASLLEKNVGGLQTALAANGKPQTAIEIRSSENAQQQFLNPDGRNGRQGQEQQQQQQQRRPRQDALRIADFMNQLRLGLVDLSAAV